ncbi:MAG: PD-(D/E)XK nuclease family protein, partial [Clostridia bacterium]
TMALAKIAGCKIMATGFNQLSVELPITLGEPEEVIYIKGHPDGILIDDETYLVECKSMSSFSFEAFERGDIDDTYLAQVNIYMHVLNLNKCIFLAINKNNGIMNERIINYDEKIAKEGIENLTKVLMSTKENLPEPRYEPNDKGFYPWNCLYCPWHYICKTNAEKVLIGKSYKLKEKQQPKLLKKEVVK